MRCFTQKKFLSLTQEKQEKVSAERIQTLFINPLDEEALIEYNQLQNWLGREPLTNLGQETLSNRYHDHIRRAGIQLKESAFLPRVKTQDRLEALPNLGYHIFLDELRSAHNVGSILRTVEAFQLGSVYFSENTPFIDQKKVKDASMGSWEWVHCEKSSLELLPKPWICLETAENAEPLARASIPQGCTLIIGNEEYGCSLHSLSVADRFVQIPLRGRKNSLNVSNAFAILAYQLLKNFTST